MRDYAKAEPRMWHGKTFKALRKDPKALVVGMYLMTSPSSNMLGLFAQPIMYMAYETGLGIEGASEGLRLCIEAGFCSYDEESEFVWVHEMAKYQIAPELKATDLRCKGVQKEYEGLSDNPFLGAFFDRYQEAFHLTRRRSEQGISDTLKQAPSKPLRSQEQEQEQEQELFVVSDEAPVAPPKRTATRPSLPNRFPEFWDAWPSSPRKVAKAECEKRWKARSLDADADAILTQVDALKSTDQWQRGFEPAPLTFLNQRRWEDAEGSSDLLATSHGNVV